MGGKVDALFPDVSQACKGKHLKAAGICKHGAIPGHKTVQPAEIVDQRIQARYKQQPVRGVALRHSLQTVETDMPFPNSGIWQPQ